MLFVAQWLFKCAGLASRKTTNRIYEKLKELQALPNIKKKYKFIAPPKQTQTTFGTNQQQNSSRIRFVVVSVNCEIGAWACNGPKTFPQLANAATLMRLKVPRNGQTHAHVEWKRDVIDVCEGEAEVQTLQTYVQQTQFSLRKATNHFKIYNCVL